MHGGEIQNTGISVVLQTKSQRLMAHLRYLRFAQIPPLCRHLGKILSSDWLIEEAAERSFLLSDWLRAKRWSRNSRNLSHLSSNITSEYPKCAKNWLGVSIVDTWGRGTSVTGIGSRSTNRVWPATSTSTSSGNTRRYRQVGTTVSKYHLQLYSVTDIT